MLFTSIVFGLFFFGVVLIYYILPGKFQWIWLLLSGIFFYMFSNPAYIVVPVFIILISYYAGLQIQRAESPKKAGQFYLLAIIANIAVLVFLKYANFFTSSAFSVINFT